MLHVDFGIAWKWEYDNDFVNILDWKYQQYNIQTFQEKYEIASLLVNGVKNKIYLDKKIPETKYPFLSLSRLKRLIYIYNKNIAGRLISLFKVNN